MLIAVKIPTSSSSRSTSCKSVSMFLAFVSIGLPPFLREVYSPHQEDKYIQYRNKLIDEVVTGINLLDREYFVVKQHLRYVDKYSSKDSWRALGHIEAVEIKDHLAPLIVPSEDDELAKRFDYLMFTIELADIAGKSAGKAKDKVVQTANSLSKIGTIPQVLARKEIIERVKTPIFWASATVFDYEMVREALRDLIKFIEKSKTKIYYTNFTDEILSSQESSGEYQVNGFESYNKKVNRYITEHQDNIAIYKLKNNKRLVKQDFEILERVLWNELGTKDDYNREFGDTPLTLLVRQITGLSQEAANEAFTEFLNNESLDSRQIGFVKTIVDYVVKNGYIADKKALQDYPFDAYGSILDLFPTDTALKIVSVIDMIQKNAIEVESA